MNNSGRFIKVVFASIGIFLIYLNISYSQISPLWQVSFNDSLPEDNFAVKCKIDNEDNIVILARGSNSSLGTGVDFILIKYDGNGQKLWNRRFNGTGNSSDYPADMVIDRYNSIYVTGSSWGGATMNDYLTLKYSPSGELLWSRRFNWLVSRNEGVNAMALDSNQNVYVTGYATAAYNGNELYDMVTVKYNSEGEQKWAKSFAGYLDIADWGYTVVSDLRGNIYVSGFTLSSSYLNTDIISIKYDSLGNEIWQRRFDNKGDDYIRPLFSRVDANDNLIVASYYNGDSSLMDYLTYIYDSSGTLLWSRTYDGGVQRLDWIRDLTVDRYSNVIVTGSSWGIGTSYDFMTIKYSPAGNELWQSRVNDSIDKQGSSNDQAASILCDRNGNILVYGWSTFWQDYSCVLLYNSSGNIITKFRNFAIRNAVSINLLGNSDFVISGLTDPKTITARYLNIITNIDLNNTIYPDKHLLYQNFPNPFNPKTQIRYSISLNAYLKMQEVQIRVFDVLGKEISVLVKENKPAGNYNVEFDGSSLASGIYFYSLFLDNNLIETKRMILLK